MNKDRIFFEGIGAIQELNLMTLELKARLDRLECLINKDNLLNDRKFYLVKLNFKSFIYYLLLFIMIM